MHPRYVVFAFGVVLLALLVTAGCSTYQNVTGYFNTYYNAQKLFSDAVKETQNVPRKLEDTLYILPPSPASATSEKFDKVIEKCSKLIQFYPQSSWIDDGILMIGVSYIYKGEYESAIRKFQELLDNFPGSNLRRKTKLWDAKAEYFLKRDDVVLKITKDLFDEARTEGDNEVLLEMLMLEAQIYFERQEYDQAAVKYELVTEIDGDNNIRAIAAYQLGLTYERLHNQEKAAEAYSKVKKFGPTFALEFQSRLKYGRMLTASGQYNKALDVLDALFDEQLKNEERALVDLEIANTDWALGDTMNAFALYALIDTVYRNTDAAAKGYYQRGVIFEKKFFDLKTALKYYNKAKDEFANSEITVPARQKTQTLTNYFKHYNDIKLYDSLYVVALHQDSALQNQHVPRLASDTTIERVSQHDTTKHISDSVATEVPIPDVRAKEVVMNADSLIQTPQAPPDAGLRKQENTGVRQRFAGRNDEEEEDSTGGHNGNMQGVPQLVPDSSKTKDKDADKLRAPPQPQQAIAPRLLSPDSVWSLRTITQFELAGLLYLELHLPDSALVWFQKMIHDSPASPLVARSLYAMAEIYRSENDSLTVDSLYKRILADYSSSEYASKVRSLLGMGSLSSVDPTLHEYQEAEKLLLDDQADAAMEKLTQYVQKYPKDSLRPKAMYTIGWAYENIIVDNEKAAEWYKKIVKEYPLSPYAQKVQPKLAVKNDPNSLSQYVRIKEIQPLQQGVGTSKDKKANTAQKGVKKKEESDEDILKTRSRDSERDDDEDEEEAPDPDDDNNDNN